MEQKNGFTLIEVLGVVVIIAAISLLAFPPIIEQIRKSHSNISESTLQLIYTGSDLYMDSDKGNYIKKDGATYCIPLRLIVNKGFLNDPITDTMNNKNIDLDQNVVKAVYGGNTFSYTLVSDGSCVEKKPAITFEEIMSKSNEVAALDPDQNKRYVGVDPDNYVWFNEELWRIIGVFDGQVKLIKDEYYSSEISWDSIHHNNWSTASLQETLNGEYLSSIQSNDSISYSYIDLEHVWSLGGMSLSSSESATRSDFYTAERSKTIYEGNSETWTGAIGLMYPSDFGYATNEKNEICDNLSMYSWGTWDEVGTCTMNSWLYDSRDWQWTITSLSNSNNKVFKVLYLVTYQHLTNKLDYEFTAHTARPVLFLKPNVGIIDGTGDRDDPYILDWINA